MSERGWHMWRVAWTAALTYLAAHASLANAAEERVAVAKMLSPTGTILRSEDEDKPWQVVAEGGTLYSDDLLLGLAGAEIESSNGAVRLTFRSDLSGTSPLPIIETAVFLHPSGDADLDYTLDRGRIQVTNHKEKGAAHLRSRVRKSVATLTLEEPGASAALEVYGRWPAGAPFNPDTKTDEGPALNLLFLVLQGQVHLKTEHHEFELRAPPGPALIAWDSVSGVDPSPERLEELPAWVKADDTSAVARQKKAILEEFRKALAARGLEATLDDWLASDDPAKRRVAILAMGATDDLHRLGEALSHAHHPDVTENGVLALRHWIGRGPGQDQKLFEGLQQRAGMTRVEAATVVQLLHGFSAEDLARPETYQMLLDYLGSERLPVRGLAYWHLLRLVPEGKKLGYDPLAAAEDRARALREWEKLIPPGRVPSQPKP